MEKKSSVSSPMTKDLLMKYTLFALLIISVTSIVGFGTTALIMVLTAVGVALLSDYFISKVAVDAVLDVYSSAVAGMIVALSFSSGIPFPPQQSYPAFNPPINYLLVAVISAVTIIFFKKMQGLLGRKYVNPAAAAKLLILAPIYHKVLMPMDHLIFDISSFSVLKGALQMCYTTPSVFFKDPLLVLTVLKGHGWLGGASSIAVIAVGIALIVASRGYIKWKIPLTYLTTTAIICAAYGFMNGEDVILRMFYHLFIGSSIFLAFFMATDPATTPLTSTGQVIFGVGLSVLSLIFQLHFLFLGGGILALVIMNLTVPVLDRIGIPKPREERTSRNIPKSKKFDTVTVRDCIRCGKCLDVCPVYLSPILIKEAAEKGDWERVKRLGAEFCVDCGQCSYVCPARIELKDAIVSARETVQAK